VHCASAGRRRQATSAYDVIHKTGSIHRITAPPEKDRDTAISNMLKNLAKIGRGDIIADRQTHRETDRHAHRNTALVYRWRSNQGRMDGWTGEVEMSGRGRETLHRHSAASEGIQHYSTTLVSLALANCSLRRSCNLTTRQTSLAYIRRSAALSLIYIAVNRMYTVAEKKRNIII